LKSINYALNLALYVLYLAAFCKDRKQQLQANHNIFMRA
jgi:hypothetical protein